MQRFAILQLNRSFAREPAVDPGLERVVARREPAQSKSSIGLRHHKIWRIENEDEPAHVFVNVTAERHQSGRVKNL